MSAMLGAIEIYNKPRFSYRDEVFVILLINAWELLLKAMVSKAGGTIYYPKRRGEPYRTLSWNHAFWRAAKSPLWPKKIPLRAVEANLELLANYRDSAVHFYNDQAFGTVIYSLAQTSIVNFRDVASAVFNKDLADEMTWRILPLAVVNPIDPVDFMRGSSQGHLRSRAVQDFLAFLKQKADSLEAAGTDTSRLITVFDVSLQSTKKVTNADIVVGITTDEMQDAVVISRRVDPNVSHPHRQKDVLPRLRKRPIPFTTHTFQAVVYAHKLREDPRYCWRDTATSLTKWSPEVIRYIDALSDEEVTDALNAYAAKSRKASS